MVVGHILMIHTCSLICPNHIEMTAHTPAFFTELGTTHMLTFRVLLIYILYYLYCI